MADLTFKINGLEGLINRLKNLPDKLQKKGARRAARKAMTVVRNAARDRARQIDDPESAENISKNIITQESVRSGRRIGGIVMRVGVRGGARRGPKNDRNKSNPGGDTRHWRYVEFGTENTPAQPFMRPALENNTQEVTEVLVRELWTEIVKAEG